MFADAYRGRGVSGFMCKYALTRLFSCFCLMLSCFICRNLTLPSFKKGLLFFSNEINFCCNEISFFYFKLLYEPKLAKTVLILIKQNLRYILNFSVTPYFEKSCVAQHGDLFDRLFYIDTYRHCFIVLSLLLLLLLNVIAVAVSQLKLKTFVRTVTLKAHSQV